MEAGVHAWSAVTACPACWSDWQALAAALLVTCSLLSRLVCLRVAAAWLNR